jgi:hypothetical protein
MVLPTLGALHKYLPGVEWLFLPGARAGFFHRPREGVSVSDRLDLGPLLPLLMTSGLLGLQGHPHASSGGHCGALGLACLGAGWRAGHMSASTSLSGGGLEILVDRACTSSMQPCAHRVGWGPCWPLSSELGLCGHPQGSQEVGRPSWAWQPEGSWALPGSSGSGQFLGAAAGRLVT